MKATAIIQARMTSSRLPGKILLEIEGIPLLEYQRRRLAHCRQLERIIIATTDLPSDDRVADWCAEHGVDCFRGSETDVLERYYLAAKHFNVAHVVRITSDCPLIDPAVIDQVVERYWQLQPQTNYVSNTLRRSWPRGMDAEVFSFAALEKAYWEAKEQAEREHVTVFFYKPDSSFQVAHVVQEQDWSEYRLTVDTPEDFQLMKLLIGYFGARTERTGVAEIVDLLKQKPQWAAINAQIEQLKFQSK